MQGRILLHFALGGEGAGPGSAAWPGGFPLYLGCSFAGTSLLRQGYGGQAVQAD